MKNEKNKIKSRYIEHKGKIWTLFMFLLREGKGEIKDVCYVNARKQSLTST